MGPVSRWSYYAILWRPVGETIEMDGRSCSSEAGHKVALIDFVLY